MDCAVCCQVQKNEHKGGLDLISLQHEPAGNTMSDPPAWLDTLKALKGPNFTRHDERCS